MDRDQFQNLITKDLPNSSVPESNGQIKADINDKLIIENITDAIKQCSSKKDPDAILYDIFEYVQLMSQEPFKEQQDLIDYVAKNRTQLKKEWEFLEKIGCASHLLKKKAVDAPDTSTFVQSSTAQIAGAPLSTKRPKNTSDQKLYDEIRKENNSISTRVDPRNISKFPLDIAFVRENNALCKLLKIVEIRIIQQISVKSYSRAIEMEIDPSLADYRLWQIVCTYFDNSSRYSGKITTVQDDNGVQKSVMIIEWDC